jgi:glyoxylase-like metal-dependent hydrolase (beta-lactamase superfamily II)
MSDKLLAAINQLANSAVTPPMPNNCLGANCAGMWGYSSPFINTVINSPAPPKPIRFIMNTSAAPEHVGGNQKLASAGFFPRGGGFGAPLKAGTKCSYRMKNVLPYTSRATQTPAAPTTAQPTDVVFDEPTNAAVPTGKPCPLLRAERQYRWRQHRVFPSLEVIAAGNIFSTVSYPVIDLQNDGSIEGVINGLNHILDLAVAEYRGQGGTWVIPSHGRLSDLADVASYRNMLVMIRDRVQDSVKKGMTLDQVKASRPTMDFDGRYGSDSGSWTTAMFVEAVYKSLKEKK